jgi:hypothetical protein
MYLSDENVEQWRRNRWEAKKALRWNQSEQRDRPRRNDLADYRVTKRCAVACPICGLLASAYIYHRNNRPAYENARFSNPEFCPQRPVIRDMVFDRSIEIVRTCTPSIRKERSAVEV